MKRAPRAVCRSSVPSPLGGKLPVWPKRGLSPSYSCLLSWPSPVIPPPQWRNTFGWPARASSTPNPGFMRAGLGAIDRREDMRGCFT